MVLNGSEWIRIGPVYARLQFIIMTIDDKTEADWFAKSFGLLSCDISIQNPLSDPTNQAHNC